MEKINVIDESKWEVRRSPYDSRDLLLSDTQWWKDLMAEKDKQLEQYNKLNIFQKILYKFKHK